MSALLALPVVAFCVLEMAITARLLWQQSRSVWWWIGFLCLGVLGSVIGWKLGFLEIRVSPRHRWAGVPFPIGFFVWEGDRWTDFVPPPGLQFLHLCADIALAIGVLVFPFLICVWLAGRRKRQMLVSTRDADQISQGD